MVTKRKNRCKVCFKVINNNNSRFCITCKGLATEGELKEDEKMETTQQCSICEADVAKRNMARGGICRGCENDAKYERG